MKRTYIVMGVTGMNEEFTWPVALFSRREVAHEYKDDLNLYAIDVSAAGINLSKRPHIRQKYLKAVRKLRTMDSHLPRVEGIVRYHIVTRKLRRR